MVLKRGSPVPRTGLGSHAETGSYCKDSQFGTPTDVYFLTQIEIGVYFPNIFSYLCLS
jgi:hypothetical protein